MPYTKIWIHLIWSTKNREKSIIRDLKQQLISHIKENCNKKGIIVNSINCVSDHIHILISLHPDQKLSNVVQLIKGESSFWINKNKLTRMKFEWQSEYMAASVSESNVERVRKYILNQETHHTKKSFSQEIKELLEKMGYEQ
jgi:REP element-mobilizing transposase RayT